MYKPAIRTKPLYIQTFYAYHTAIRTDLWYVQSIIHTNILHLKSCYTYKPNIWTNSLYVQSHMQIRYTYNACPYRRFLRTYRPAILYVETLYMDESTICTRLLAGYDKKFYKLIIKNMWSSFGSAPGGRPETALPWAVSYGRNCSNTRRNWLPDWVRSKINL